MWATVFSGNTQRWQTVADNSIERTTTGRMKGRSQGKKYLAVGNARPHFFQVTQEGLTHGIGERVSLFAARLGTSHRHQLLLPVQVLQSESADFADSQSVNGEQHDYGSIPDLLSGIAFRSREQALHVFPRWAFWQLLIGKQARGHNRHCQTRSAPAALLGVAKEAAQRRGVGLN